MPTKRHLQGPISRAANGACVRASRAERANASVRADAVRVYGNMHNDIADVVRTDSDTV